jgi:hypothetical protein
MAIITIYLSIITLNVILPDTYWWNGLKHEV